MTKPNVDIEMAIVGAGLRKYQIANKLGINDGNFSRKLRNELDSETKSRIYAIIEELREGENQWKTVV